MANIIINESQLHVIREFERKKEVFYYTFESKVRSYLKSLLENPTKPHFDAFFADNGIKQNELQNKMMDLGLLVKKKEGFNEPEDANGKKHSVHFKQFSVKNANFSDNMHKLFDTFFKDGERKDIIKEEGGATAGGFAGGASSACGLMVGSSDESGGVSYPFGKIQRRAGYNSQRKKKTNDITKQDSNVDMSPAMDRTPGKIAMSGRKK